ncbi:hypothetical protein D3C75_698090 [compost metagenome]
MERMYEVNVKFGEHTARTMSLDEFSAVLTAVGQVWSAHTVSEYERGYIASMPCVSTFESVESIKKFLEETNEDRDKDEEMWLEMTITHHDN